MRRIRFESEFQQQVIVPDANNIVFNNGETKLVQDTEAAILLKNPNFVDADTGKNPTFCCSVCDEVSLSMAFLSPRREVIPYQDASGRHLCIAHYLDLYPHWRQWHEITVSNEQEKVIDLPESHEAFKRIAMAPTNATPELPPTRAIYVIGRNAAEGDCEVSYDEDLGINITFITNRDEYRSLKRTFNPGRFVPDDSVASAQALDGSWRATDVIARSQGEGFVRGQFPTGRMISRANQLLIPADVPHGLTSHLRWIIRGEGPQGCWSWRNATININSIPHLGSQSINLRSVLIFGKPSLSEHESNALWDTLCFLEGRIVQPVAVELYDTEGSLLQQIHRRGKPETHETVAPFAHSGRFVPSAKISELHESITRMHEADFDITRILHHMLIPTGGHLAHEALHLSIAVHTLMREWTAYWKRRSSTGDPHAMQTRRHHNERGTIIPKKVFKTLLPDMLEDIGRLLDTHKLDPRLKLKILRNIKASNEMAMGDRLFQILEDDLAMTITDDDRRALGYRNELTHEGGFSEDLAGLEYDKQNVILEDVGRLRNIATEAVLRLCGYQGVVDDFTFPGGSRIINSTLPAPFITE